MIPSATTSTDFHSWFKGLPHAPASPANMTIPGPSQHKESSAFTSPSLLPQLETLSPLPITHLSGLQIYLSDWKTVRQHADRPQPPIPARMAPDGRRLSTAIPRPSSGTSRRLISGQRQVGSCLTPLLSPEKARRAPQPRLSNAGHSIPSPSFYLPRSLLPRSESLLTDFETDSRMSRILESPSVPLRGLPKSHTTPAILSPNKDIASHSLLRPLGPPVPRSSTFNNVSALQSPSNSPSKVRHGSVKICFDNINAPERSDIQFHCAKSLQYQRPVASGPQALLHCFSNSLAPFLDADGSAAGVANVTPPLDADPRFVYKYEISSYWTGRYVALMDRLRARTFIPLQPPKKSSICDELVSGRILRPKKSTDFARIELNIEKEAIKILRSFCQTEAATEGLDHFERLLRKKHFESVRKMSLLQLRPVANVDDEANDTSVTRFVPASDARTERRMLSGTLPQRMFRKASSTLPHPRVEKRVTIGHLPSTKPSVSLSPQIAQYADPLSQQDGPTRSMQGQVGSESISVTLPKAKDAPPRMPLRTPSNDRLNIGAPRNSSHREVKQTITLVDGGFSLDLMPKLGKADEARQSSPCDSEDVPPHSSRRFRKSESIKQLVDYGIREVRKMSIGKRRLTLGAASGIEGA